MTRDFAWPHPWPDADIARGWRDILDLLDHPEPRTEIRSDLLEAIRRNRMEALVHHRLSEAGAAVGGPAAQTLKGAFYARRYFYERYRGLALEIHSRLSAARIPCQFVKGPVAAAWFHDPPWIRPFSDVDVIVPFETAARSRGVLESMGFEARPRRAPVRRERESLHALDFVHREETDLEVELHQDPGIDTLRPGWHLDAACRASSPLDGLPTLALEAHVLFLCAHLYYRHSAEACLIWLHDVHEAVNRHRDRFDWGRFRLLAERLGWARAASRVLSALDIYGDGSAPEICRGMDAVPSLRRLTHTPGEKFALLMALRNRLPSRWERLAFVLGHLCPSRNSMILRYRLRRPLLWLLAYPLHWLRMAGLGAARIFHPPAQGGSPE